MKHVGRNIKALRQKHNWNQAYVASRLKITIGAYSKIETGCTDINLSRLAEFSEIFDVSVNEILSSEEGSFCNCSLELAECKRLLLSREKELFSLQRKTIELYDILRSNELLLK